MFALQLKIRTLIFGISDDQIAFARRGFRGGTPGTRRHLERIGQIFLYGYDSALKTPEPNSLELRLRLIELEFGGFAYEGAAMALGMLDWLTPWNKTRFERFLRGPGAPHAYMVHAGLGWALAQLRRPIERRLSTLDPLLRWLVVDGYGFHAGYFHWPRYVERQETAGGLAGYARLVFDQGLGRSLWFVDGADAARIPRTIAAFPPSRRADLWSGVGLACTYAGGVDREAVEALAAAAGDYWPQMAQGAAFAAKARQRAGNPAAHTEMACQVICGVSAEAAASITDEALKNLPRDGPEPAYEVWRCRIQARCADFKGVSA